MVVYQHPRSPPEQKEKEHHDRDHELLLSPGVNYRRLQRNIRDTNTAATAGLGWAGLGWAGTCFLELSNESIDK